MVVVVLAAANLSASDPSTTLSFESLSSQQQQQQQESDQSDALIATIFATIDHLDIVNGAAGAAETQLLQHRTVRWFDGEPATLCSAPPASEHSECFAPPERPTDRHQWDGALAGAGLILYGSVAKVDRYACLFEPAGTYLLVDEPSRSPLEQAHLRRLLGTLWTTRGAYRVYVRARGQLYGYDPFRRPAGAAEYGALVQLEDGRPLPTVPLTDFGGYPLRIEVFRSVYSNPDERASASKADQITYSGPDVMARDVFCRALNVTGKLV